ncbi:MAG: tetratricopeptide repeat protein [Cyclobacteriaceae bacterium]
MFKLNTRLFPKQERPYISLGRGYEISGQNEEALRNYKKALVFDPGNKRIQEMIRNINQDQSSR